MEGRMVGGAFSKKSKNHVSLQCSHFYCTTKYILLQMLPRTTIHEDKKHLELERVQGCGKAVLSVLVTEGSIPFSVQEVFTETTRRLELLISSLKHKQVVSGSVA